MTTHSPTAAKPSRASQAWIVVFLLAQCVIPLRYYFSDDPFDERFAWRMFSGMRVTRCQASAFETSREGRFRSIPLAGRMAPAGAQVEPIYGTIHPAWEQLIERGRRPVIDRFLEFQCDRRDSPRITLVNRCRTLRNASHASAGDRPASVDLTWSRNCKTGMVSEPTSKALAEVRNPR